MSFPNQCDIENLNVNTAFRHFSVVGPCCRAADPCPHASSRRGRSGVCERINARILGHVAVISKRMILEAENLAATCALGSTTDPAAQ